MKKWNEETIDEIIARGERRDALVKLREVFETHNDQIYDLPNGLMIPYTCPIIDDANSVIDEIISQVGSIENEEDLTNIPDYTSEIRDNCASLIEEHEEVRRCNEEMRHEADTILGDLDIDTLDTDILDVLETVI